MSAVKQALEGACPHCGRRPEQGAAPRAPVVLDFLLIDGVFRWPFDWASDIIAEEEARFAAAREANDG
jgi:hypothetical protein